MDRFGDLHRQLARRHEHEAAGLARTRLRLADALQHRQRERGGLAGAGFGLPEQVAALEQQRNRFALNRRRFFVAEAPTPRR